MIGFLNKFFPFRRRRDKIPPHIRMVLEIPGAAQIIQDAIGRTPVGQSATVDINGNQYKVIVGAPRPTNGVEA